MFPDGHCAYHPALVVSESIPEGDGSEFFYVHPPSISLACFCPFVARSFGLFLCHKMNVFPTQTKHKRNTIKKKLLSLQKFWGNLKFATYDYTRF